MEASTEPGRVAEVCDVVFLTVPDSAIETACRALEWKPRHRVIHCSGALGLDVLSSARERGALVGCLHPLQSFPARDPEPGRFTGISCGVEAEDPLGALLEGMVRGVGARPFRLEGVDRTLYHASAVFASNFVVGLMSAASRLWALAGLPEVAARDSLSPLLLSAATNVANKDLAAALTGPIARGDVATVEAQLAALRDEPALRALYRGLSGELVNLAVARDPAATSRFCALLDDSD